MDSSSANRGLIPRLLESLFTEMDARERAGDSEVGADRVKFSVQVEFVEIYNGATTLDNDTAAREDGHRGANGHCDGAASDSGLRS